MKVIANATVEIIIKLSADEAATLACFIQHVPAEFDSNTKTVLSQLTAEILAKLK